MRTSSGVTRHSACGAKRSGLFFFFILRHFYLPIMSRARNWVFTTNNYTDESLTCLRDLSCRYLVYGKELAPTTNTPHLQGFVVWENAKSLSASRRLLPPGSHIIRARGTPAECRTYCTKDGDWVERGDLPTSPADRGTMELQRWDSARAAAKVGDYESIPSDIFIRCYSTLKRITTDYRRRPDPLSGVCGIWIYGQSGAGKTRSVTKQFPNYFDKSVTKWWDGYQQEEVVVVDDLGLDHAYIGYHLKRWADFSPFNAEIKGGTYYIRPRQIIVTSQYTIEEIWTDEATRTAISRRFLTITKEIDQEIFIPMRCPIVESILDE